jgi:hypothetical protein
MTNFVGGIISIVLGVVLISSLFIPTVKGVNTSTWSAGEVAMWGVVSLIAIVGLVAGVAQVFGIL